MIREVARTVDRAGVIRNRNAVLRIRREYLAPDEQSIIHGRDVDEIPRRRRAVVFQNVSRTGRKLNVQSVLREDIEKNLVVRLIKRTREIVIAVEKAADSDAIEP